MQFSKIALLAVAAPALAQLGGELAALPSDLENYVESLETNTAVAGALAAIVTASQVQGVVAQILTAKGSVDPTAFAQSLEVAASQAIANEPSSDRAVAESVIGVITSLAAKDGVLTDMGAQPTGGASQSPNGGSSATGSSGSQTSAGSSASVSKAGAPKATGMALGALVAGVAGVAMAL